MKMKLLLNELWTMAPVVHHEYSSIFQHDLPCIPVPFFGNLEQAKVITIGVNPSDGEMSNGRWPEAIDVSMLHYRLSCYFTNSNCPPHPWFKTWSEALAIIGLSYASGDVAHVDICPWPTRPMSSLTHTDLFIQLLERSLPDFWRCIKLATNASVILVAGSVSKKHYINEFLARNPNGIGCINRIPRPRTGPGFVTYHELRIAGRKLPVFFCSVSPSARTRYLLPLRINEHRVRLLSLIAHKSSGTEV